MKLEFRFAILLALACASLSAQSQSQPAGPAPAQTTAQSPALPARPALPPGQGRLEGGVLSGGTPGDKSDMVVLLTNTATNTTQRLPVGKDGLFETNLPPGTYRIEVERDGKRQVASQPLVLTATENSQATIQVDLGPIIEEVNIEARASNSQEDAWAVGRSYNTRTIRTLPITDRNYQEISGLLSGITPPGVPYNNAFNPEHVREYNTNGLPAYTNDTLLDGISVREPFTGILNVRVLPAEAAERLNMETTNPSPDNGYAAGAVSNVFTRPGTAGFHGSAFGFHTNDKFEAHNPLQPANVPTPKLRDWQYGASAGGTLIPDTLYLFGSYQGIRNTGSQIGYASLPTAAMRTGDFSALGVAIYNPLTGSPATGTGRVPFPLGIIPGGLINPGSAALLAALPAPNQPGFANNYAAYVPSTLDSNIGDARLDYRFSDALTGYARYGISYAGTTQNSLFGPSLGSPLSSTLRNQQGSVGVVGNYYGIVGELRVGYGRYRNGLTSDAVTAPIAGALAGLGFGTTLPPTNVAGLGLLGTPAGIPGKDVANLWEGDASFHMYRRGHQFTFGVNVRRNEANGFEHFLLAGAAPLGGFFFGPGPTSLAGDPSTNPNAIFARSIASFLLGLPLTNATGVSPLFTASIHQMEWAPFIQDAWHVSQRLTINLGLRYELYGPVETRQATGATFFTPNAAGTTGIVTTGSSLNNGAYSNTNFAPRVGIAYGAPLSFLVRAGYGINYFPLPFSLTGLNQSLVGSASGAVGSFTPFTITPAPGVVSVPNVPYYVPTGFKMPYTQNYYFMLQRDLPFGFLMDAAYVGNNGRRLPLQTAINAAAPGTGITGIPFAGVGLSAPVTQILQGATSNYNALQVNLTKQLSKGASVSLAYTFSKALDYGTAMLNPFAPRASNYGPADWDRTNVLTISHIFALPVGQGSARWNRGWVGQLLANWEFLGIFHYATGTPYSVFADPTACACPGNNQIIATPASGASTINGSSSISSSLFTAPLANTFGAQGRNSFRGPDFINYDASLFKSFSVRENFKIELRGEAFNLINSSQYANPANNISFGTFGQSTSTVNGIGGRLFRVGARILF